MFGIENLLLLLGSCTHIGGNLAREKIKSAQHADVGLNASRFRSKLEASFELRKAIEKEYSDPYRYEMVWERIERYKRMYPEFCRNVSKRNAWFDWDKVGEVRLRDAYEYKSKDAAQYYSDTMQRLLSMTCGKISFGDALDYAVSFSYPGDKKYQVAQYLYTNPIPQLSSPVDFIKERARYENAKLMWRERYPVSKRTSLNPIYYSSENIFREAVDKELRMRKFLTDRR